MSSILPAVDALLGIRNTSVELREAVKKFEARSTRRCSLGGFSSVIFNEMQCSHVVLSIWLLF